MKRITTTLLTGGLLLSLAACGGDDEAEAESAPATTSAAESSSPAEDGADEADGEESDVDAGEFAAAGTELAIGEQAVVPFVSLEKPGALGLAVTGIAAGTVEDLAPLDLGDRIAGMTPYYITIEVTNVSGTDFSYSSLGLTNPVLADGSIAQSLSVIGEFPPCDDVSAGADFTTAGATYTTCVIGLATAGTEVTGAEYTGTGSYSDDIPGAPEYSRGDGVRWMQ